MVELWLEADLVAAQHQVVFILDYRMEFRVYPGAGAPFGRVMTGQPISNDSQDWHWYLNGDFMVVKVTDAEAAVPVKVIEPKMIVMDLHCLVMVETGASAVPNQPMMERGTGNTMAQLKASRTGRTCYCGSCSTYNQINEWRENLTNPLNLKEL